MASRLLNLLENHKCIEHEMSVSLAFKTFVPSKIYSDRYAGICG
jgi:hypothetical protein